MPPGAALAISVRSGAGMAALREKLAALAREMTDLAGPPPLTRERHRAALQSALERLQQARAAGAAELRAEDLRAALLHLGTITGRLGVEDVLDSVFRQFCIGK
jgi:tRNA modification GTPase